MSSLSLRAEIIAQSDKKNASTTPSQSPGIDYVVAIQFPENQKSLEKELTELLLGVSEAHRLISKPPASILILKRRANADIAQLNKALRAKGYYAAQIDYSVDSRSMPVQLQFMVTPGKQYLINEVNIRLVQETENDLDLPSPEALNLASGSPAEAATIIQAEQILLKKLNQQAYAYAQVSEKNFRVNHHNHSMRIQYEIQPGPKVFLERIKFEGVDSIQLTFLESLIPWQKSTPYHPKLFDQAAQKLSETDLFSTVRIRLPGQDDPQQREKILLATTASKLASPVFITLKERKHRTIKGRLAFATDTGIAISAQWVHRNLWGGGEKLTAEGAWSSVGPLLSLNYRKPYFLQPNQAWVAGMELKNEDTDAYESSSFNLWTGIERQLRPGMDLTLGVGFSYSEVKDKSLSDEEELSNTPVDSSENFALLYLPVKWTWDFSNDLFEPDKGGKLLLEGSPFVDINSNLRFGKLYGRYIHYQKVTDKLVLAGRFAWGNIFGAQASEIPGDERFYAGGGGSVRGYGYQLASPLDNSGNPQGGKALLEMALESRIHFGNNIGGVAFIDGGAAFAKTLFDASNEMRYGAGIGVRYRSPIGPLRADIAIPLQRRKEVDDAFQLYLSIGHAY